MKKIFSIILFAFMIAFVSSSLYSAEYVKDEGETKTKPEDALILQAKDVFISYNNVLEEGIPRGLVYAAQAIAIFPKTQSGGVIIGGMSGKGIIINRLEDGSWSAPAFLKIKGGSFGFQFGAQEIDIVLMIMDRTRIEGLLRSKLKLGIDAGIAVGPAGRDFNLGTDIQAKSVIYSYSKARGLYIGLKLEGTTIYPDEEANRAIYGKELTTSNIIKTNEVKPTLAGEELIKAVEEYTKREKK